MEPSVAASVHPIDVFGAGVYTLTLITHATLWWGRRERPSHFWLASSALGALLVDLSWIAIEQGMAPVRLLTAVNLLGVVVALTSLYELVEAIGGRRTGRIARGMEGLLLAMVLAFLVAGTAAIQPLLMALGLLVLVATLLRAAGNVRSGDRESRVLAVGLLLLLTTLIYDVLSELLPLPRLYGMPVIGFTLLYVFAARALSLRYEREYRELVVLRGKLESRVQQRTAELEDANRRLDALSRTDVLTGLANRRSFVEAAGQRLATQANALLMIDIDHFKAINDRHGHAAGDAALRSVADALQGTLREHDLLARWGGEEFIALLDADGAQPVAERLREAVAAIRFRFGETSPALRVSIGLSITATGEALESAASRADAALYDAKRSGRDRVVAAAAATDAQS